VSRSAFISRYMAWSSLMVMARIASSSSAVSAVKKANAVQPNHQPPHSASTTPAPPTGMAALSGIPSSMGGRVAPL
jgi:hypothetical protein